METDEIMSLLVEVAEAVVNPRFRALAAAEIHEKKPGDLVTDADREAEQLITAALRRGYPDAVVLGEEAHSADPALMDAFLAADHAFTVDPVDGTKNFVHGSPDHAVMLSETRSGEVVRSWIWQPQHGLGYVAERGGGAFRNGQRLPRQNPSAPTDLRGRTSARKWMGQSLDGLPPMTLTWVSCGIDYPKLAEGEADYLLYRSVSPWDHAPGSLLLAEVGGLAGAPDGQRYEPHQPAPRGLVAAASPAAYEQVCRSLATSGLLT